jgi:hypothetical protein
MSTGIASQVGTEWGGEPDDTGWPTLRPAARCDGENPMTGQPCISGWHKGHHRDANGAEWLDD